MENKNNQDEKTVILSSNNNKMPVNDKTTIENKSNELNKEQLNSEEKNKDIKEKIEDGLKNEIKKPELPKKEKGSNAGLAAAAGLGLGAVGVGAGVYFSDELKEMAGLEEISAPESPEEETAKLENENKTDLAENAVANPDQQLSAVETPELNPNTNIDGVEPLIHSSENSQHLEYTAADGSHLVLDGTDQNRDGNFESFSAKGSNNGESFVIDATDVNSDGNFEDMHVEYTDKEGSNYVIDLQDHDGDGNFDDGHVHAVMVDGTELDYEIHNGDMQVADTQDYIEDGNYASFGDEEIALDNTYEESYDEPVLIAGDDDYTMDEDFSNSEDSYLMDDSENSFESDDSFENTDYLADSDEYSTDDNSFEHNDDNYGDMSFDDTFTEF